MKKTSRKLLFFFFAAAFLVSAPLVVLYTAGFRVSLNNQRIQQTGAIAVSTNPRGASINVDGRYASGKTPSVIQNVLSGETVIKLEKKGYLPWEQTVHVDAGETTYVSPLLFSDSASELFTPLKDLSTVSASPNGRYLAILSADGREIELSLYDVITKYQKTLTAFPSTEKKYALSWLPDTSLILLTLKEEPVYGFTLAGQRVEGATLASLASPHSAITFSDNGQGVEVKTDNGNRLIALLPNGSYTLLESDDDYVLVRDGRKTLYLISLTSSEVITLDVAGSQYDWLPGENLLVWSDGLEVSMYDAEEKVRTFLTRQSELIEGLVWHPSGQAVIIGTASHITAIETKEYKDRVHSVLVDTEGTLGTFWLDSAGKNLYFTQENVESPGLYRRRLVK
jgi:WD40 repeat protein